MLIEDILEYHGPKAKCLQHTHTHTTHQPLRSARVT